ncbi:MAG: 5'-3'-deoxyribonucleotidase [Anaerolineales bacterium]|nr:5'-3'-deoxyribonucleotidase [Anaerolineales bacterium]
MRVLIDMDGVIADFDKEFLQRWQNRHPDKAYIPLNERNTFYVKDQYPDDLKPLVVEILLEPGFFREMIPVPGAIAALLEMQRMEMDVFICSSPLSAYKNSTLEKYEWVEINLGYEWTKRVVLTKDKTIVTGDILIDDKPVITGVVNTPLWEHIVYDRPYNRAVNKRRITWGNWKSILEMDHLS